MAIDKYREMFDHKVNEKIHFVQAEMSNLPVLSNHYDLALSIGVIHNATSEEEYFHAFSEIYRILKKNGTCILSIFTNDVVTDDLSLVENHFYTIRDREPMILYSKNEILSLLERVGFRSSKVIDEHVTDVGSGSRYVYSVILKK